MAAWNAVLAEMTAHRNMPMPTIPNRSPLQAAEALAKVLSNSTPLVAEHGCSWVERSSNLADLHRSAETALLSPEDQFKERCSRRFETLEAAQAACDALFRKARGIGVGQLSPAGRAAAEGCGGITRDGGIDCGTMRSRRHLMYELRSSDVIPSPKGRERSWIREPPGCGGGKRRAERPGTKAGPLLGADPAGLEDGILRFTDVCIESLDASDGGAFLERAPGSCDGGKADLSFSVGRKIVVYNAASASKETLLAATQHGASGRFWPVEFSPRPPPSELSVPRSPDVAAFISTT